MLPLLIGVVIICILFGLLVYFFSGFLDKFQRVSYKEGMILKHQGTWSCVIVWSLYICHQVFNWSMLFYAQFYLETSHKLQPFHYWMAGVNLLFVQLHLAQSHITYDGLACKVPFGTSESLFYLSIFIHIAESDRRGLFFYASFYSSSGLVKLAKKILPFFFSTVILFSFWHHPLEATIPLLVRLVFELIFIIYSCLIKTPYFENKYWMLFLELLVNAFIVSFKFPNSRLYDTVMSLIFVCQLVFVVSRMHQLPIRKKFKMVLDVVVIACFFCVYTQVSFTDGVSVVILYYTNVVTVTGLVLVIKLSSFIINFICNHYYSLVSLMVFFTKLINFIFS